LEAKKGFSGNSNINYFGHILGRPISLLGDLKLMLSGRTDAERQNFDSWDVLGGK